MTTNIILLSSDIPKGMKSYGPRSLIPIGKSGEPLIVKQIKKINSTYSSSKYKINVVVGFESDKVIKTIKQYNLNKNIHFIYDDLYESANNTYGILKTLKSIKPGNCLIIQSGVVGCYKPLNSKKSSLGIIKSSNDNFNIGVRSEENKAVYMFYDLDNKWSEIAFIGSEDYNDILSLLLSESFSKKIKSSFWFETINALIEHNITFNLESIKSTKNINKYLHYKNQQIIC